MLSTNIGPWPLLLGLTIGCERRLYAALAVGWQYGRAGLQATPLARPLATGQALLSQLHRPHGVAVGVLYAAWYVALRVTLLGLVLPAGQGWRWARSLYGGGGG